MSRIVVVGSCGFIGGHLVDRLIKLGHEVIGVDNFSSGKYMNPTAEYHKIDIGDYNISELTEIIEGAECVFHLAARARVQPSFDDPIGYHNTNVTGTLNLLEACRLVGVRNIVFSSSSSVYGNFCSKDEDQCESDELNPSSPYAFNKVIGEAYCRYYQRQFGMKCKILRYFNVYGDRMIPGGQYAQAIQIFLNNYKKGERFKVFGNGEQRRDFTHVSDVVEANIKAMEFEHSATFNIGTGTNYSVNELCEMIAGEYFVERLEYLPSKNEPKFTLANNKFAALILEWKPKVKLPEWIREKVNVINFQSHY